MNSSVNNMIYRRALGAAIIIFIAVWGSYAWSFTEGFWITTIAMLVMQTAVGLTARHGLQRCLIAILCVSTASYLIFYLKSGIVIHGVAIVAMAVFCYFSLAMKISRPQIVTSFMIGIIVLMALIIPCESSAKLMIRVFDVAVGGLMGFLGGILIFPIRADVEFAKEAVPLLSTCSDYLTVIVDYLFDHSREKELIDKKIQLEISWENFPDWVYETGFTAILQQGHRHFLIRLEEARQILLTLDHLAQYSYDADLLMKFRHAMQSYQEQIKKLIQFIIIVLESQKLSDNVEDVTGKFETLEKEFQNIMPNSLEMLEINEDYVYLAHFIFEMKELGEMFLILARTLR